MKNTADARQIEGVTRKVRDLGCAPHVLSSLEQTLIGVGVVNGGLDACSLGTLPGVERVVETNGPYRLAARGVHPATTVVCAAGARIGRDFTLIAGPCSVESERRTLDTAEFLVQRGVKLMRGGAFKPRTSPYSFQGLGVEGLAHLAKARERSGIGIVTEVLDVENVARVQDVADVIQVGARSMQNYPLLKRVGKSPRPVLLKRGMAATIEEWLLAAEYVMTGGNGNVILCERGVRSFCDHSRNVLDLAAVPSVRALSHLPIIVDPSHGTGNARLVPPMSLAALAAGADGLLIEVHPCPAEALCDGAQALEFAAFERLLEQLNAIAGAMGTSVR
ncbi:MAG: 3-deoxy-7-phosphoheptulonate synthase [Phycisphaerae bacterium]